jgi:uncharacterized metal-binding protein
VQQAPEVLMIDGCPLACGANSLKLAGITAFKHFQLHELGIRKHQTEVTAGLVERLADAAKELLASPKAPS